ncbi:MAG TPA: protein-glutamine glutaminase family protein [Bacteriovoracaceae bacterium]|nr:protein-glutamine glutaminase family protein [Bacteriovoracaceae bacterium]
MRCTFSLLSLFTLLVTSSAFAFEAKVLEVVPGFKPFAKLDNGEVRFLDGKSLLKVGQVVKTDTEGFSIETVSYDPSVLPDQTLATTIFEEFRGNTRRRSQCFNRAHIWTYEEYNKRGTKLLKNFLFFTNRYIRNYNYKWWFHVAPMAIVNDNGVQKEMILDWEFAEAPEEINLWVTHFVTSGNACPTVQKYSDYSNNQEAQDCYFIKTSMYFWAPQDIEAFEKTGVERTEFIDWEIKQAYKQAF